MKKHNICNNYNSHTFLFFWFVWYILNFTLAFPSNSIWNCLGGARGDKSFSSFVAAAVAQNLSSISTSTTCSRAAACSSISTTTNSDQDTEWTVRGGGDTADAEIIDKTTKNISEKEIILQFIKECADEITALENFHIQGWRWHTQSLILEVGRLHDFALKKKTNILDIHMLQEASDYVIDFNLKGLSKIETEIFFPWLRKQLITKSIPKHLTKKIDNKSLSKAFGVVMDELENDQKMVDQLGKAISINVALACDTSQPQSVRKDAISIVADQSAQLQEFAQKMQDVEDTYLVPSVAAIVPEREQKSFNTKVLRGLGLWDSRLHLVSMYEAAAQSNDPIEVEMFKKSIPSIPQMMIPRWRRKLYAPKTYMFD